METVWPTTYKDSYNSINSTMCFDMICLVTQVNTHLFYGRTKVVMFLNCYVRDGVVLVDFRIKSRQGGRGATGRDQETKGWPTSFDRVFNHRKTTFFTIASCGVR